MQFRQDLVDVIVKSHKDTWVTFDWVKQNAVSLGMVKPKTAERWETPGEPAFVSNLLEYPFAYSRLRQIISDHLGPLGLCQTDPIVSGVFIHQKPKVVFGKDRSQVELGDLLLVRQHFQYRVAAPQGRALLVQAKSAKHPQTGTLRGKEEKQFSLYADWSTPFYFPHKELGAPPDGSKLWNFSKSPMPLLSSSGWYGIVASARPQAIHSSFPDKCPWAIGAAKIPGGGEVPSVDASSLSLAEALEDFLLGRWGRPWDTLSGPSDHWSSFIKQCLQAAANWKCYPIKRLNISDRQRRRDVLAIVEKFAAIPQKFAISGHPDHQLRDLVFKLKHDFVQENLVTKEFEAWLKDVEAEGHYGGEPPEQIGIESQEQPRGGVSVLYIVTFGEKPLLDSRLQPTKT